MVESARFGLLLCGDITSDAVLRLSLDEISRRLETRLWCEGLTKNQNGRDDGGYNDFEFILISGIRWGPVTHSAAEKGIDHDGQALACNSLILHPK